MSELLERVEYAIDYQIQNHGFGPHVARAAILAVAEWLDEQPLETGHETYDMATAKLFRELERLKGGGR